MFFTPVCHSVHRGMVYTHLRRYPPGQTILSANTAPGQTPPRQIPPPADSSTSPLRQQLKWVLRILLECILVMISNGCQIFNFLCFRVIWIVCVSAAMILFVYQVADRTLVYFDYNTKVSVKVHYTDEVPFLAVTVCDINTFRFVF